MTAEKASDRNESRSSLIHWLKYNSIKYKILTVEVQEIIALLYRQNYVYVCDIYIDHYWKRLNYCKSDECKERYLTGIGGKCKLHNFMPRYQDSMSTKSLVCWKISCQRYVLKSTWTLSIVNSGIVMWMVCYSDCHLCNLCNLCLHVKF